jgi:hypothetical protein
MSKSTQVYLEAGQKKTVAAAVRWPGWCRIARDETAALAALVECGPRYASVLRGTGLAFKAPAGVDELAVVERLKGTATTDFGAPDRELPGDDAPVDPAERE